MADFRTHFTVACSASGILATVALYTGEVTLLQAALIWGTGTLGGLLPDIDSDNSFTLAIISSLMAIIIAVTLGGFLASRVSLFYNLGLVTVALWMFRAAIIPCFTRITVHRGNWHSLSAAFLFAFCLINGSYYLFDTSIRYSILLGIAGGSGFLIHLILDEIYAISLGKLKLKRSFGTAFKLWDFSSPVLSTFLLALCLFQIYLLPKIHPIGSVINKLMETTMMGLG